MPVRARAASLWRTTPPSTNSDFGRGSLGRLDTATGAAREWPSPGGARSRPYGIAITPDEDLNMAATGDGRLYLAGSGVNKVAVAEVH